MANYTFNGVDSGQSNGTFVASGPVPDFLYITYPRGFDTLNIRTDNQGNTILESALGGTFVLKNVTLDQLTDANFGQVDGDVDIGTNGPDWMGGSIVVGKAGNDFLWGQSEGSDDFLAGNAGEDDIDGNGGMDRIRGGQDNDEIYGFGSGSIVYGDKGSDDIEAADVDDPETDPGATIFGGSGDPDDPFDGGDWIDGANGNDIIQGNGGNDDIDGEGGHDIIRGGKDNDDLNGDDGNDWLRGDKGDDDIDGDRDADILTGGADKDTFHFHAGGGVSDIGLVTQENIDADALNILPQNFGLEQLHMLDSITDLNLGDNGFHGVDKLAFAGWDSGGADAGEVSTVTNVAANNMEDLLAAYYNEVGAVLEPDDQAVIIEVNSGAFAGKDFLFVSTADVLTVPVPNYVMQITGYTGTLDASDIIAT